MKYLCKIIPVVTYMAIYGKHVAHITQCTYQCEFWGDCSYIREFLTEFPHELQTIATFFLYVPNIILSIADLMSELYNKYMTIIAYANCGQCTKIPSSEFPGVANTQVKDYRRGLVFKATFSFPQIIPKITEIHNLHTSITDIS